MRHSSFVIRGAPTHDSELAMKARTTDADDDKDLPLVHELSPSSDPWSAFLRLAHLPYVMFFDSAAQHPIRGRYSYICASPFECLVVRGEELIRYRPRDAADLESDYEEFRRSARPPLEEAAACLEPWKADRLAHLPPFQGGAAGYFGYGLSGRLEELPTPRWNEFEHADMVLGLYDWVVAFDHQRGACHLVTHGFPETSLEARRRLARARAERVGALLEASSPPSLERFVPGDPLALEDMAPSWPLPSPEGLRSNFTRDDYLAAIEQGIESIRAGDIFQVNLSQRLLFPARWSPVEHYRRLRTENPAPFAGYFDTGEAVIASSSPEQFLELDRGTVVTRPIKGTRPRGYTPHVDSYLGPALLESEKDRSENVMIVDLLRNDLSKVAEPGSITVPRLFEIERHPTVYHLVSEVRGKLRAGLGAFDLLAATFPGGSITGAPKVRAMEIIAELEPTSRGAYCGSMGWIGFDGGMNTNILIRTVTLARGWLQIPVGGGIVAPSRPEAEYQETLNKAEGMLRALVE